ncbi:MAG: PilZ domain-containing protein [Desulfomonilaceae bacterium]
MRPKKQIPARPIVADIKAGMTNAQLMERYQVSAVTLEKVFKKLKDANLMTESDLDGRLLSPPQEVVHGAVRQTPRCYTIMKLPITDMDNLNADCHVRDLTEKGLQIVNVKTKVGEKKSFLIQASEFGDIQPFSFEAQCRWTRAETETKRKVAGFEITRISRKDLERLREFVQCATFCE